MKYLINFKHEGNKHALYFVTYTSLVKLFAIWKLSFAQSFDGTPNQVMSVTGDAFKVGWSY